MLFRSNNVLRELSGRNTTSIQAVNIVISPVLGLRLEPEETSKNKDLSTNKQKHDPATPVQLIRVDKVGKDGRQHKSSKLLANKTESDSLGTCSLGSSLLCNSPTKATDSSSIEHRPCNHECEKGGVGGVVTGADHRCAGNDDGPASEECTTSDEGLSAREDVGNGDGDEVGEELEGGGDGG